MDARKIKSLPHFPGVYRFLDKSGNALYIGKAKNLRARVKQYFSGSDERPQIPFLMKEAKNLDYTVVNTELESLYLERTLIQKHHPKYNIELKDDKSYAFIVIDYATEIPQITITRRLPDTNFQFPISPPAGDLPKGDNFQTNPKSKNQISKLPPKTQHLKPNTYYGPYTSAKKIHDLIFMARKTFGLCSAPKVGKPCFYFHLHRCPGVCVGIIKLDEYNKHLDKIKLFLSGKITPTINNIKSDMVKAAGQKKFEKAASLRDQLRALEMLEQRQNVIMARPVNWDIIGLANNEGTVCVNLFKIRDGKMLDKENFIYSDPNLRIHPNDPNILQTFLEDYYSQTSDAPKQIYLPASAQNENLLKTLIKTRLKKIVKIIVPKKGKAFQLVKLSRINAEEHLKKHLSETAGHLDKIRTSLNQLKEVLNLSAAPKRIECYDISNIQGTNAVGSMVVFIDGLPKKSEYRKFKIQNKNTPDDVAMMKEMLSRRLNRIMNQELRIKNTWPVPDLIVIDGGKGQLNAVLSVLRATRYSLLATPAIGLAKRIEEIFLPGKKEPLILPRDNLALQLLQRLRDEAHRFGLAFHRQLRFKQAVKSALDNIPGIGPKTKKLLKRKFGTVANIKKATLEELTALVGEKNAQNITSKL